MIEIVVVIMVVTIFKLWYLSMRADSVYRLCDEAMHHMEIENPSETMARKYLTMAIDRSFNRSTDAIVERTKELFYVTFKKEIT